MKGMRKVSRGSDFAGVVRYVFSGDKEKRATPGKLLGGSFGSETTPRDIVTQFEGISALKGSIKKAVWHNSLRLQKGETVSDERWVEIGDEYMRKMGFSEAHPRIYVLHDDYDGQHIHIVASRVAADGTVFYGQNENLVSTRVIASLEKQFALTITKGVDLDEEGHIVMPDVKPLRKGEIEKAIRTGEKPVRTTLQEAVETALAGKPTTTKFMEKLESAGVTVATSFKGETFNGFSFGYAGIHFSASELGDKYKLSRLKRRLNYDEIRDHQALAERRSERGNHARSAKRDLGQATKDGGRPCPGDSTNSVSAEPVGTDDHSDDYADRADRAANSAAGAAAEFAEAIDTVVRIAMPAQVRWQEIYDSERKRRRAKLDRERREAEEAAYQRQAEWARKQRLELAKQRRPVRFAIVVAEPASWMIWRKKQMVKEYGRTSELLALFFMRRDKRRREIAYEYAGARIVDHGPMITADNGSYAEIDAMLELAKVKGWSNVKFFGSDGFKEEAMRHAQLRGFRVDAAPGDEALLERVKRQIKEELCPRGDRAPRPASAPRPRGFPAP
jgi:hypothetical protein